LEQALGLLGGLDQIFHPVDSDRVPEHQPDLFRQRSGELIEEVSDFLSSAGFDNFARIVHGAVSIFLRLAAPRSGVGAK
jgi:hypothetical protein